MSVDVLYEIFQKLGLWSVKKIYYKKVGDKFNYGLKQITDDNQVMYLEKNVDEFRIVEVYTESPSNNVNEPMVEGYDSDSDSDDSDFEIGKNSGVGDDSDLETFEGSDEEVGLDDEELLRSENVVLEGSKKVVPNEELCYGVADETEVDVLNQGFIESDGDNSLNSYDSDDSNAGVSKELAFTRVDLKKVTFKVGMKFVNADELKGAVTVYGIQEGKNIKNKRISRDKISMICLGRNCQWKMFGQRVRNEKTFRITSLNDKHTCSRSTKNRHVKSSVIAKLYLERIRINPTWKPKAFREQVGLDLQCNVSYAQAVRALIKAKQMIEGNAGDQYSKLWDYLEELKISNPGTTAVMKVEDRAGPNGESRFKSLYICWGALKRGFVVGCRPVIGIDGCHLTGPCKGVLLTAVAIDANNCMYPFAYGVVSQETTKTWKWFLKLIRRDLAIGTGDYTFISDKQKGLIKAMDEVMPGIEHRFCVRHMYNNFKQLYKGMIFKDLIWEAARACTLQGFNAALEKIKSINQNAYEWIVEKPGENWSRSHFRSYPKCDVLLNNMCESFNACILEARSKPILQMLEMIRQYLMEVVCKKKTAMDRCKYILCPKIQKRMEELKVKSHEWIPCFNGDMQFEVKGITGARYAVDLEKYTCGCRRWELCGIPCVHAIAAMNYLGNIPEEYVHICYHRSTYLKAYSNALMPVQSQELWVKTNKGKVLPPVVMRMPGRPKKARRRDPAEKEDDREKAKGKPSRKGMKMSCRNCGQVGHNLRGCLMPKVTNEKGSVSGSKRKKLSESTNETARNDEGLGDGQNVNECEQDAGNVTNMDDGLRDVPVTGDEFYDEEFWTQIACEDSLWNLGSQSKEHDSQLPTMTSLDSQLGKKVMSDNSQVPNMIKKDAVSSKGKNVMPITDMTAKSNDNMTSFDPVSSKGKSVVMSEADMNVNSKISAKIVGKTATIKKVIGKQPLKKLTVRRSSRIMNVIPKGPPKVSHIDLTGEDDEEDNGPLPTQESVNQMEMQTDSLVDILATPAATSSKSVEPPSSLHAGIMQPLPPALPKGQLLFKGRMYTTLAGLKNSSSATRVEEIEKMKKKSHDDMLNELYEELKNRDGEEEAGEKAKQP